MSHTPSQDELLQRDLLQARLIAALFANTMRNEIVLKGGLAIRAVLGSERYTKDIDLAHSPEVSHQRLQGHVRRAIKQALATGLLLDAKVTEPKQTETTSRWKINGRTEAGSAVQLTIETKCHPLPLGHIRTCRYEPPAQAGMAPALIESYDATALAAAKVAALAAENRSAPRDLYDLHLLVEMCAEPPIELLASLGEDRLKAMSERLWAKIEAMSFWRFRAEVAPYLPAGTASRIDEGFYDSMRLTVGEKVGQWLLQAVDRSHHESFRKEGPGVAQELPSNNSRSGEPQP